MVRMISYHGSAEFRYKKLISVLIEDRGAFEFIYHHFKISRGAMNVASQLTTHHSQLTTKQAK